MTATALARTRRPAAAALALLAVAALAAPASAAPPHERGAHAPVIAQALAADELPVLEGTVSEDAPQPLSRSLCSYLGYPLPYLCPRPKSARR